MSTEECSLQESIKWFNSVSRGIQCWLVVLVTEQLHAKSYTMQISATVFILVLVLGHREEVSGATIADRLSPMALIIGGTDVEDGKAPYLAGLVYNNSETYCGGSIIAARWILTAAHCVTK